VAAQARELSVQPLIDWLDRGAPPARTPQEMVLHLCRRMLGIGLPIHRVAVFVRTLHPNVLGRGFIWHEGRDFIEIIDAPHGIQETDIYLKSPIRVVFAEHTEVRRRLTGPDTAADFPVVEEMRAGGATDFLALPLRFVNGEVHAASFATRRPGGFSDAEVAALRRLMAPLARVAEIYALMRTARNILDAYLGRQAGEKVLAGRIRRGDGEDIHAVLWFCDLRDSTPLADSMSREDFLRLLNEFFECVLDPVLERQGEVLRFIGDAALAIFPVGTNPAEACAQALAAARDAIARMAKLNEKRQGRPLAFGIALHLGDVLYGNIGTPTRLEFTVIGAAANEAARIESLCRQFEVSLLVSDRVVRYVDGDWKSLGHHKLRGVGEPIELFTPLP
jgi:adenylate cyclase